LIFQRFSETYEAAHNRRSSKRWNYGTRTILVGKGKPNSADERHLQHQADTREISTQKRQHLITRAAHFEFICRFDYFLIAALMSSRVRPMSDKIWSSKPNIAVISRRDLRVARYCDALLNKPKATEEDVNVGAVCVIDVIFLIPLIYVMFRWVRYRGTQYIKQTNRFYEKHQIF
jgi:hypothetical protein